MIDQTRRALLSAVAATTTAAAFPSVASAIAKSPDTCVPLTGTGIELTFARTGNATQTVTVTNTTGDAVSLKHVYPGIVHANGQTFDINAILAHGPVAITPGRATSFEIKPVAANIRERPFPPTLKNRKSLRVSTSYKTPTGDTPVHTLRSYMV